MAEERKEKLVIAVDGTKLKVEGQEVYVWAAVEIDTEELSALDASYRRSSFDAYLFPRKALRKSKNKPIVLVDDGLWCPWTLQSLGLVYVCKGFRARSAVEGFFRHLKERTIVFYLKMSEETITKGR